MPGVVGANKSGEFARPFLDDKDQLGGEIELMPLPGAVLEEVVEGLAVGFAHALAAAAQGLGGEGDHEPGGIDGVEDSQQVVGLVAEAGDGLEEEGDVGARAGSLDNQIDQAGFAVHGGQGEEAVEETDHFGVDVGGDVEGRGGKIHPGEGQRVEAAGEVEDFVGAIGDVEDALVEAGFEVVEALGGGSMLREDLRADFFEERGVALGIVEAIGQAVVGKRAGVGAEDLVEAALGAFFGVGGVLALGEFLGGEPCDDGGGDVAIAARFGDGGEDGVDVGSGGHCQLVIR